MEILIFKNIKLKFSFGIFYWYCNFIWYFQYYVVSIFCIILLKTIIFNFRLIFQNSKDQTDSF